MPKYFFDTSALAKLYRQEATAISSVELFQIRIALEADLGRRRLSVAAVNDEHFRAARQLLFKHGSIDALRALDALQLSVALGLKQAGLVTVFVAADQRLCRVATLEGLSVTNPEQPTSIVI